MLVPICFYYLRPTTIHISVTLFKNVAGFAGFVAMAVSEFNTLLNMDIPNSVNAKGRYFECCPFRLRLRLSKKSENINRKVRKDFTQRSQRFDFK